MAQHRETDRSKSPMSLYLSLSVDHAFVKGAEDAPPQVKKLSKRLRPREAVVGPPRAGRQVFCSYLVLFEHTFL